MKQKSLLNAVKKTGLKVQTGEGSTLHWVVGPKNTLSWYVQDERATCVHIQGNDEESDSMRDYFPGFFPKTIKYAIESLKAGF